MTSSPSDPTDHLSDLFFSDLDLPHAVRAGIAACGFVRATPVPAATLSDRDALFPLGPNRSPLGPLLLRPRPPSRGSRGDRGVRVRPGDAGPGGDASPAPRWEGRGRPGADGNGEDCRLPDLDPDAPHLSVAVDRPA